MDWVDTFVEETEGLPSPPLFRRWAAISAVSASMERKTWVKSLGIQLFPNMYNVLVGGPGSGKTFMTRIVQQQLQNHKAEAAENFYLASANVTKAAFIDELNNALRRIVQPDGIISFNALQVVSNELGTLISKYDTEFINTLTDLYDGINYSESKRSRGTNIKVENPLVGLLAACTPAYLRNLIPEGAWDEGFLSRVILVFSSANIIVDPWRDRLNSGDSNHLRTNLYNIYGLRGQFKAAEDAKAFVREWHMSGGAPRPDHPRLEHYNTRRIMHLLKLAMIASVSRSRDLSLTLIDTQRALGWLLEVEAAMPELFKAMRSGGDMELIKEATHWVAKHFLKKKLGVPKHMLVAFLAERTPAQRVDFIIQVMLKARLIQEAGHEARRVYKPGVRT